MTRCVVLRWLPLAKGLLRFVKGSVDHLRWYSETADHSRGKEFKIGMPFEFHVCRLPGTKRVDKGHDLISLGKTIFV